MTKLPPLSKSEVARVVEDSRAAAKFTEVLPTWSDVTHALGGEAKPGPDGEVTLDVPIDTRTPEGQRKAEAYIELMTPAWARQAEHAQNQRGKQTRTLMRDAQGRERRVLPEHEDHVGRKFGTSRKSFVVKGQKQEPLTPGRHVYVVNEKGELVERP